MKAANKYSRLLHCMLFTGALGAIVSGITGCTMTEPLATEQLQQKAKDPRISVILLRFRMSQQVSDSGLSGTSDRGVLYWSFAVSNESTGWNFRQLDRFSMIFNTRDDSLEPSYSGAPTGWVTFLAPQGVNYIAVTSYSSSGWSEKKSIVTYFPDHVSVSRSADIDVPRTLKMDFTDEPRFVVEVPNARELIYAGTLVLWPRCGTERFTSNCPYEITVIDESKLAEKFVSRYPKGFVLFAPLQTRLLAIPQSRTIEIRSKPANRRPLNQ